MTYDNCNGLTGTITWSGDTYTLDVSYDFASMSGGTYTGQMTYGGTLTISDTLIDGDLDLTYDITVDQAGVTYDYSSDMAIAYDNVGLDTASCPSSGTLDIEGHYAYDYAGQSYDSDFHTTYAFNACNDVTVTY